MKNLILFPVALILLFGLSCNQSGENIDYLKTEMADADQSVQSFEEQPQSKQLLAGDETPPMAPPQPEQTEPATPKVPRQIIKTANYRIRVKDVDESAKRVNTMALKHDGFISTSEMTNSSYEITNAITIRVPASKFDSLFDELGAEALFTQYKKISSQDVTEEYVDIVTRLNMKKQVRDRYVEILRNKAKTVEDILKAEEQIRVVQEEIEAKEGRLRYIKDQVAMSTIHLELYQELEYRNEPDTLRHSFWSRLLDALGNGWKLLQGIVLFAVTIWPVILVVGLLWWKRRWIWNILKRRKETPGN